MAKTKKNEKSDQYSVKVNFHGAKKIVSADWIKNICFTIFNTEKTLIPGNLSIVLVSDEYITTLNKEFLNKDRPTDVLAFPMNEEELWGEIYISVDRALEQSEYYKVNVDKELARLVIHGILHLLGYNDQQPDSKINMRKREDFYLNKLDIR